MANPKGNASKYQAVAASATATSIKTGAAGEIGDFIAGVLIIPATTSPGQVLLLDSATSITLFVGGATSVADLKPFYVELNMASKNGPWKITTGANVSVICVGKFS